MSASKERSGIGKSNRELYMATESQIRKTYVPIRNIEKIRKRNGDPVSHPLVLGKTSATSLTSNSNGTMADAVEGCFLEPRTATVSHIQDGKDISRADVLSG